MTGSLLLMLICIGALVTIALFDKELVEGDQR